MKPETQRRAYAWIAGAVAALFASFVFVRHWPELEVAFLGYEVTGVDVSRHQERIDWTALAGSGVAFAYVKASEGADHVDARFAENWRGAWSAKVARGAYHFLTLCQPGRTQARHFLKTVGGPGELPPALDAEHMGPCRQGPTAADPAAEVIAFLDEVERVTGERPIVYTNRRFHDAFLKGRLEGERFWIRSIGTPPRFRVREWVIWQIDDRSRRPGIQGPVDLNVFRGSKRAFDAFVSGPARADDRPRDARRDP